MKQMQGSMASIIFRRKPRQMTRRLPGNSPSPDPKEPESEAAGRDPGLREGKR